MFNNKLKKYNNMLIYIILLRYNQNYMMKSNITNL